jgi:CheY-like chemotaxis protein
MAEAVPTILLVDDEDSVRKVLAFPLERDGFAVIQAADGEEALEKFSAQPIDLVVLDIMLPRLDGLEVCKRLRATSTVPIIMLTARDDELDKVIGLELGADDYITKPFSIREFRSRVRALLRRARAPHAPDGADEERIEHDGLVIDVPRRLVEVRGDVRRVRAPAHAGGLARPGVQPPDAARGALEERRLPRSADDRRPRPPPSREARTGAADARVHPDRARRRLPLQGPGVGSAEPGGN